MLKIYLLIYSYRWGYEDHGTNILAAYRDLHEAEAAALRLNEERNSWDQPHEDYYVEEVNVQ